MHQFGDMMHKKIIALLLLISLIAAGCVQQPTIQENKTNESKPIILPIDQNLTQRNVSEEYNANITQGRIVFGVTDARANLGIVTAVYVNIDSLRAHSNEKGWFTVPITPKTYNLMQLQATGNTEIIADSRMPETTYQQVRLNISKVIVVDDSGEHDAKLPSGELRVDTEILSNPNSTSTVTFDFLLNESLHSTGKGMYIMAPVVRVETWDVNEVRIRSGNKLEAIGGKLRKGVTVGMDEQGNVGPGRRFIETGNFTANQTGALNQTLNLTINQMLENITINQTGNFTGLNASENLTSY